MLGLCLVWCFLVRKETNSTLSHSTQVHNIYGYQGILPAKLASHTWGGSGAPGHVMS